MAWYESSVFYHIYPLGLCGAPQYNNGEVTQHRLHELQNWIPHIKRLGCTAIYIGPLFESVGHGYETTDYKKVDCRLGTNEEFRFFVDECHEAGLNIIVDGVFNHTGREFFAFKDILQNRQSSAYLDWYCNVNFYENNEFNDGFSYDSWRDYNILAKLNLRNPEVKQYLFDVIRFWVQEFNIDGIRLDAADVLDFDFMGEMRNLSNEIKEAFWLMGEVIHGDYSRWTNDETLHSVTNYELHKGLYSGHNDHNYFEIAHTVKRIHSLCLDTCLYTFVDNHDVNRIASKLNNKEHLFPVYLLLYTLPGIPSIYYGSEFAIEGIKQNGSDEPIRPCIHLEDYLEYKSNKDVDSIAYLEGSHRSLLDLIVLLGGVKKNYKELTYGSYKELVLTNRQYAFARVLEHSALITAVNNDDNNVSVHVPLPLTADNATDVLTGEPLMIEGNSLVLILKANHGCIIHVH